MRALGVVGLMVVCAGVGAMAAKFVQQRAGEDTATVVDAAEDVEATAQSTSAQITDLSALDEQTTTAQTVEQPANRQPTEQAAEMPVVEQRLSEVDRTLPAFELQELDESVWTAESLQGKPWVINFWATWCPPCIEEIPSMNAAYEFLEPRGVGMLAINAGEGAIAVESFFERIAIDFPNVLGDADTLPNWAVKALPTTIVVDANGNVVYEALGPREWDDEQLLQRVVDLL